MAAAARPSCSSFVLKADVYNPKNPAYVAILDTESTKGAPDSMLVKLRATGVSVSFGEMGDAFVARLPGEVKTEMILYGFARLASHDTAEVDKAAYEEALMVETALRAAGTFTLRDNKVVGRRRGLASSVSLRSVAARNTATTTRGEAIEAVGLR